MKTLFALALTLQALTCITIEASKINDANPTVTTPLGKMKGATIETVLGKSIYAFRGIRYAKPPVGELRFQVQP